MSAQGDLDGSIERLSQGLGNSITRGPQFLHGSYAVQQHRTRVIWREYEESTKECLKLKDIPMSLNRRHDVEAILTEWESLVTVAKAVESDMINWDAELPAAVGCACLVAQLVALAPVPQADLAANHIMMAMAFRPRVQQRLQFSKIARVASTLPSTNNRADMLILLLALEWSDMHKSTVEELPIWNSELGQEFRKDLFNTWMWLCGSVKKRGTGILERVLECCNELVKTVGLAGGSEGIFKTRKAPAPQPKGVLVSVFPDVIAKLWKKGLAGGSEGIFKNRKAPAPPPKGVLVSVFPGVIAKLWKKGKLFLFGGESISASRSGTIHIHINIYTISCSTQCRLLLDSRSQT